jgi:putative transposase
VEEIFAERNVKVDHSTLNRWVIKYLSSLAVAAKKSKRTVAISWRTAVYGFSWIVLSAD